MSNAVVGELYGTIIGEVMDAARADFLEEGYDDATLQDFRSLWMAKVAASATASFPWAPQQHPPPPQPAPVVPAATGPLTLSTHDLPRPEQAALRAAQQIQQLAVRNGEIEQTQADNAIGLLMQQAQAAQQQQQQHQQQQNVKEEEQPFESGVRKRALSEGEGTEHGSTAAGMAPTRPKKTRRADIDLDDEAINSDLDDSDDDALNSGNEAEEGEGDMQTVLCLYDKVARTKNKWKCVLKDGLVSLNGRDYAFSKANGEFEW